MNDWFTIGQIDERTFILSEYRHWEETHCYLLNGSRRSLLIDTGLGIQSIHDEVVKLTDKPITAVPTHIHWDHIGGLAQFPDFYVHAEELAWLDGGFPLPLQAVRAMVADRCALPEGFDLSRYSIFQGRPAGLLANHDVIDLGGRQIEALHTPGHSPGHLCFWERATGYLFTGDLVYKGTLFANYLSTDPEAYLASIDKIAALPAKKLFPAHHSLEIRPEILLRMQRAFHQLQPEGLLRHGSGRHSCGDWELLL